MSLEWLACWLVNVLARLAIGTGPYSGMGKSPMFGDFEAQRHWMELTVNLPVKEWYVNSTRNDLLYWGLDYPPLTAYHSYAIGKVAQVLNSSWVELEKSRGIETYQHKMFMRLTVLCADLLLHLPILYTLVTRVLKPKTPGSGALSPLPLFLYLGLYPGLLIIDHGHFQYNNISLGLFLGAVTALVTGYHLTGSALFTLALNYKQMELYHALPVFFYLLGTVYKANRVRGPSYVALGVLKVGLPVIVLFAALWLPFGTTIPQVLTRVFPFNRGLFEDKVANIWCSLSVIFKWRRIFGHHVMVKLCAFLTLAATLPANLMLLTKPTQKQFFLALFNTSLSYFLFSFHVHEKSILLVTTVAYLLMNDVKYMYIINRFLLIALISLHPLMVKDGIQIAFWVTTLAYYLVSCKIFPKKFSSSATLISHHLSAWVGFGLALLPIFNPPQKLPDLFTMLLLVYCAGWFCLYLLIFYYFQIIDYFEPNDGGIGVKKKRR